MKKTKSKSAKSKKHKSKIKGQKMGNTWTCPFAFLLFFFCFFDLLFFAFVLLYFVFVCFFPGKSKKKQKKNKSKKTNRKSKKKTTKMQMDKSIFSHVSPFLTFLFFPIYVASCFFRFWSFAFWFSMCFPFFCFFFKFKNIRINYRGGHNLNPLNHALNVLRRDDWIYIRHIWNHQPKEVPPRVCNGCKSLVFNQIAWIFHRNSSS